jgi:hypothetical protein
MNSAFACVVAGARSSASSVRLAALAGALTGLAVASVELGRAAGWCKASGPLCFAAEKA